jgi:hypothetical protein
MRMRMLAAAVVVLVLMGGIGVLAQRQVPSSAPAALEPVLPAPPDLPSAIESAAAPLPGAPVRGQPLGPPEIPSPDAPGPVAAPEADDPMQIVEKFVERNRKEAEESIEKLSKEADALRARLQKVEAALERWKAVQSALERGPAQAPERATQRRGKESPPELSMPVPR